MTRPHATRALPLGLTMIHEDRDLLVVNKPAGLLTMGTDSEKERTAYFALTDYVRKGAAKSKLRIYIVHRLDRETSGVLVFTKSEEAKNFLQENWEETRKEYLAIVHGHCDEKTGTIESYLLESKALKVYATHDRTMGKAASTSYRVLKETEDLSLLAITPHTGRKNQIRVHLADLGHPIIGDRKYGLEKDGYKKLALHAASLTFKHPFRKEMCTFNAPPPGWFQRLMGRINPDWSQAGNIPASPPSAGTIPETGSPRTGRGKLAGQPATRTPANGKPSPQGARRRTGQPPSRRKRGE